MKFEGGEHSMRHLPEAGANDLTMHCVRANGASVVFTGVHRQTVNSTPSVHRCSPMFTAVHRCSPPVQRFPVLIVLAMVLLTLANSCANSRWP